jgi:hypothetical protein
MPLSTLLDVANNSIIYVTGDTGEDSVQLTTERTHLLQLVVVNASNFPRYLHIFNSATGALAGAQPDLRYYLPRKEETHIPTLPPIYADAGIYLSVSETPDHAETTDNNYWFTVVYRG